MKKLLSFPLLLIFLILSCDNDEVIENQFEIRAIVRGWCSSPDSQEILFSELRLYNPLDSNSNERELVEILIPNNNGQFSGEFDKDRYYFYEAIGENEIKLFSGIKYFPSDNSTVILAKGRKTGSVRERLENNEFGDRIPNVEITYIHEFTKEEFKSYSDESGFICTQLDPGRYHLKINHPGYEPILTSGFDVFGLQINGTRNYFLTKL